MCACIKINRLGLILLKRYVNADHHVNVKLWEKTREKWGISGDAFKYVEN